MLTNLLGVLALASTALGISINKPNDWTTTGAFNRASLLPHPR